MIKDIKKLLNVDVVVEKEWREMIQGLLLD